MKKKVIFPAIISVFALIFLAGCGNDSGDNQEPNPPSINDDSVNDVAQVPEGCISWFDGCNNCKVNTVNPDGPMACTMMYCEKKTDPYCAEYSDGSSDMPQK